MGIVTSLKSASGSHRKTFRVIGLVFLLVAAVIGIVSMGTQQAAAQTGQYTAAWINDRTIKVTRTLGAQGSTSSSNYIDNNPNDTNRTFKQTPRPASKCAGDLVNTITLGSTPGGGMLYIIGSFPGCGVTAQGISIRDISKASIDTTNCEDGRGGTAIIRCEQDKADGNAQFARICSSSFSVGPLCVATKPPAGTTPTAPADPDGTDREPHPCDSLGEFSLRWVTCPILTAGVEFAGTADALIESQLHYGEDIFNTNTAAGKNFKAAWNSFRTVGLSLMLIVGLIMVVSQATNLQIFDAYAFRKTLPRLLFAIIGIALSWEILEFVIIFFNDMGHLVQDLVLTPFKNAAVETTNESGTLGTILGFQAVLTGALLGTVAGLITLGPLGIISLIITIFMAIMIGLFVLLTRSAIITMAILTAPLAIACWVLPGTKKVWDFWQNALTTALFIFPIIMLLIAAGKAMSYVAEDGIMKILFLILPYVLLPFAFRLAGGLMQTVFSLTNDKTRGAFDRMTNMRRNAVKSRMEDAVQGTGKTWLSKNTGIARGVSGTLGNVYRRGHAIGQYGGIKGGFGATYAASRKGYGLQQVDEALKRDNGRAAGDDDANELAARRGMTSEKFMRDYAQLLHDRDGTDMSVATQQAKAALGTFESSYGVRMGSDTGRVVAAKALLASNTALKPDKSIDGRTQEGGHYGRAMETLGGLVADGLINESDGAAIFKQNKMRNEFAQVGFGNAMTQIGFAAQKIRENPNNHGMNVMPTAQEAADGGPALQTVSQLRREALKGAQPGQLIGGRHETIEALAPEMLKVIEEASNSNDESLVVKELAQTAGLHDSMSQGNRLNADRLDDKLLGKRITSSNERFNGKTVRQAIDMLRGENNETFMNRRREYGAAAAAQAQAQGAPAPGQGPAPPPVINPGG